MHCLLVKDNAVAIKVLKSKRSPNNSDLLDSRLGKPQNMSANSNVKGLFRLVNIWLKTERLANFKEKSVNIFNIIRSLEIGSS